MALLLGVLCVSMIFVIVGPSLVFIGIGVILFGTSELGIVLGLGVAFWIVLLANTVLGSGIETTPIVRQFDADALTPAKHSQPAVQRAVDRLAHQASIPVPAVLITTDGPPSAYTCGLAPDRTTIVVSTPLIEILSDAQLEAVLAHEISHIVNRDAMVMTIAAVPYDWAFRLGGGIDDQYPVRSGCYGLLRLFASVVLVFERMVSRTREFVADQGAVALIGTTAPLVGAIRTLDDESPTDLRTKPIEAFSFCSSTSSADNVNDVALGPDGARSPRTLSGCFPRIIRLRDWCYRTHPDPDERIERLQAQGPDEGR